MVIRSPEAFRNKPSRLRNHPQASQLLITGVRQRRILHRQVEQDLHPAIELYLFPTRGEHSIGFELQVLDPENASGLLIEDGFTDRRRRRRDPRSASLSAR